MGAGSSQHLRFQETRVAEGLCIPVTPELGKAKAGFYTEFKASLGYRIISSYLKNRRLGAWKTNCQLSPSNMLHSRYSRN